MLWFTILVFLVGLWIYRLYSCCFPVSTNEREAIEIKSNLPLPSVNLIIPAYLDFQNLNLLVKDCLDQNYPPNLIHITLVIDGSIPENFTTNLPVNVQVLHSLERKGKAQALNKAVALSSSEMIFFLDANIRIEANAVRKMVDAILEHATVTMVFGRKLVKDKPTLVGAESIYWNYEHRIKLQEQSNNCLFAATGELIAMKRIHYNPLPEQIILDDLFQSISHIQKGGKLKYVHEAISTEAASGNLFQEFQRKIRIGRGAAQLLSFIGWFPFGSFRLNLHFWQRKIARWLVFPILIQVWIAVFVLASFTQNNNFMQLGLIVWMFLFIIQLVHLRLPILNNIARYLVYFPLMQLAISWGFLSFYMGFQSHLWQKISR